MHRNLWMTTNPNPVAIVDAYTMWATSGGLLINDLLIPETKKKILVWLRLQVKIRSYVVDYINLHCINIHLYKSYIHMEPLTP